MEKKQALAYLRVSGRGQVDGDGFPRQRDAIARYAKAHGLALVGEYRDEGVSGTRDLDDRPGLADLMARVQSNGVRVVLVERADRLARDLMVGELILTEMRRAGVTVVAADSSTDLTVGDADPTRTLIRQVLGAVAEFEKSVLVAKLRAARIRHRRTAGRCEGVKPYGTKPGEAEGLALIRQLRGRARKPKRSFAAIAAELNRRHVPTRTGRPWQPSTVGGIVTRG